jgi:hypothetical protein
VPTGKVGGTSVLAAMTPHGRGDANVTVTVKSVVVGAGITPQQQASLDHPSGVADPERVHRLSVCRSESEPRMLWRSTVRPFHPSARECGLHTLARNPNNQSTKWLKSTALKRKGSNMKSAIIGKRYGSRPLTVLGAAALALAFTSACGEGASDVGDDVMGTDTSSLTSRWTQAGTQLGATYGATVATGDFNCDGYKDLAVGAPGYDDTAGKKTGKVAVYYGSATGLKTTVGWFKEGSSMGAAFGFSLGSVQHQGTSTCWDLIVGAPDNDAFVSNGGRVYVYKGAAGTGLPATPTATLSVTGSANLGYAVAGAGDVNKDGYGDIVVSDHNWNQYQGRVHLFKGGPTGFATTPAWTTNGEHGDDGYGASLAGIGQICPSTAPCDIDKDGYADVLVGAENFPGGSTPFPVATGKVYMFRGNATTAGLPTTASWTATGEATNYGFGHAVAIAGDTNKDGYADVIIGAPYRAGGKAYVYLGKTGGLATTPVWKSPALVSTANHYVGASVASAGDVNKDGYADIIVGDTGMAGGVSVYKGGAGGPAATASWTKAGQVSTDFFGAAVAGGDFNNNGYSDVAVGAPRWSDFTGKAYVYTGP